MGTLVGHVAPGLGFLLIGFWHLFNHLKLHALHPTSYTSSPWFPTTFTRYLELYLIMAATTLSISMELFISPHNHQPFDHHLTIPSNHLHNFEHSSISFSFFIYAAFGILLDKIGPKENQNLTQLVAGFAFTQELLLFHLHSADHMGVEGQYHLLLQLIILVSCLTTFIGIALPRSFSISFVRSVSIFFQGVWFIVMGFMLWTPGLIPNGCFINFEEGHNVVRCEDDHQLHRAKALVNILFSWILSLVVIFATLFYLIMIKVYVEKAQYSSLEGEENDTELGKMTHSQSTSFIHIGKGSQESDIER